MTAAFAHLFNDLGSHRDYLNEKLADTDVELYDPSTKKWMWVPSGAATASATATTTGTSYMATPVGDNRTDRQIAIDTCGLVCGVGMPGPTVPTKFTEVLIIKATDKFCDFACTFAVDHGLWK